MAGGSLQTITASLIPQEKVHRQSVVIKSDYNKGWVTAVRSYQFCHEIDFGFSSTSTESDRYHLFIAYYDDCCFSSLWYLCTSLLLYLLLLLVRSWSIPLWISSHRVVSR